MEFLYNVVAQPTRTVMYAQRCSYCGISTAAEKHSEAEYIVGPDLAVLACIDHKALAVRDGRAYMRKQGRVRQRDVLKDPLWAALGSEDGMLWTHMVSPHNLTVRRTSGALEAGWYFQTMGMAHAPLMLYRGGDGFWRIPAAGPADITKDIRVDELTLSLPAESWPLVTAFITRLNGLYVEEEAAHDAKVAQGAVAYDNSSPYVSMAYAPDIGKVCRVFDAAPI